MDQPAKAPAMLAGLRVLEIGHFVAAPFCTRLLADLGADVIKVEPKSGDPVRQWGAQKEGRSLWWSMHGRNKRSVTVNLKTAKGREIVLKLAETCDVVVENFRPGHLARLGLGPTDFRARNPSIIVSHISGFGQDGPQSNCAAFGVIGEAIGGLRHLTNHAPGTTQLPPVRVGVSIGDSIAGLYAAFGIMGALWQRDRKGGDGKARTLDVALTEAVLSMMEGMLPEYGATGAVRQPTGGGIATAAPSNAYPTSDGGWMLIAANSDPLFERLAALMSQPELAKDQDFQDNVSRVRNSLQLDGVIASWTRRHALSELEAMLAAADIPSTQVYTAAECAADPQFRYRGMVREVDDPLLGRTLHAGIVPHVVETPGELRWCGPDAGAHTAEVLRELASKGEHEIAALESEGVV